MNEEIDISPFLTERGKKRLKEKQNTGHTVVKNVTVCKHIKSESLERFAVCITRVMREIDNDKKNDNDIV